MIFLKNIHDSEIRIQIRQVYSTLKSTNRKRRIEEEWTK